MTCPAIAFFVFAIGHSIQQCRYVRKCDRMSHYRIVITHVYTCEKSTPCWLNTTQGARPGATEGSAHPLIELSRPVWPLIRSGSARMYIRDIYPCVEAKSGENNQCDSDFFRPQGGMCPIVTPIFLSTCTPKLVFLMQLDAELGRPGPTGRAKSPWGVP